MRIAVNTRCLLAGRMEGYGHFTAETLKVLTRSHPEHEFFFLFDRPYDDRFIFSDNVTPVVIGPKARHALSFKWWYDVSVPAALRRIRADVFLSPDGFCSLTTRVPQVLVIHDLAYLHFPSHISRSHLFFYRRYTPRFIHKAAAIATVSAYSKQDIINHFKTPPDKIDVVHSAVKDVFKPLEWEQKEAIKAQYTGGKEYFLYTGSIHPRKNLIDLLKAFSLFKKRQQSNMQLVIAGRLAWKNDAFKEKLATYKYRSDVVLTGYVEDEALAGLMASAYALVYPSLFEGFGVPPLEAMQCGVPVITSNVSSMPEVCGDAALYADPKSPEQIAEQMKTIYKDEALRAEMVSRGFVQASRYSWRITAEALWDCLLKAVPSVRP